MKEFKFGYKDLVFVVWNALIIFMGVNIIIYAIFSVISLTPKESLTNSKPPSGFSRSLYNEYTDEALHKLLYETWNRPYVYEPFVMFRERAYSGDYVNVSSNGFRYVKDQGPWPISHDFYNIFFFGGSTAFGYGVADNETIASRLQEIFKLQTSGKPVKVYNFGAGYYYSSQERILFEQLLIDNQKPDLAIFFDGVNDFANTTTTLPYNDILTEFVDEYSRKSLLRKYAFNEIISNIPIYKVISAFTKVTKQNRPLVDLKFGLTKESFNVPEQLDSVIKRYILNKTIIESAANSMDVDTLFVWQPAPTYNYPKQFQANDYGLHTYSFFGYPRMLDYTTRNSMGNNFVWLADIQKDTNEQLYIDAVHYSPSMSRLLAEKIYGYIEIK